jgi:glycerol-3-phosphate dehydrogenase
MDRANVVIVGGGVVGCAVASAVSRKWDDVFLLEQMPRLGMATSSRNSGVIHSGLYYLPGSLKARHALRGNRLTYEFCAKHNVSHRNTGKLVVATTQEEEADLAALAERGRVNGVEGLRIVGQAEIRAREPNIVGRTAIAVPSTGIVSSEELVRAYARLARERGVNIVNQARVERLEPQRESVRIWSTAGEIEARCLINSAGLYADEVAAMMGNKSYRIYPVRGEYCEVVRSKSNLVNGLVYPLPHADHLGLGVHFTKTVWGTLLVGPNARYIQDKENYERDRESVEVFARGAQQMLPCLDVTDLMPGYSGIRPKLSSPGQKGPSDFIIEHDPVHPYAIHLVGIESPGLTAAPSIAEDVSELASEILA